ncbi:2-dehydro-3-deoxy-6-phosphogalactonate aldolase [Polymorphobacter fuscus]|uniref:2-dehydro-3-deoxy-6-phosphogalactonate aldolase n=1 Tax=Sandarakinorhabdus fusca TaxID=1439888 RepID=A0A7C9KZG3_9SPHN|nr:2-dehydro-3-deoxy-6-phosphogalactonate aldolase [Polymorphobacter fuscus]KAB7645531.1 2-dehydro-3-deoxy-6-phosphogalactonate aldolase [Polymorphobacter fuscus]MQT17968.1 2-dehydro-3-deoxy-6-phosphogalactonate aldolase [Polymorphobacter fuscus]NJC08598.1 2-dehydro-3-deoxyphosphogalactonate aldolase [Polymorphobacter fuscus]
MTHAIFDAAFAACPLIAVLGGVRPDEVVAAGEALVAAGIHILEVPLTTPDAYESITRLSALASDNIMIGAGGVLDIDSVQRVVAAGGGMVGSPGTDAAIIAETVAAGLAAVPGIFTPSEAMTAIAAGADALRFFPAEAGSPAVVRALRSVLPRTVPLLAMGGMTADGIGAWSAAGADGFVIGTAMFGPGMTTDDMGAAAARLVAAMAAERDQ